MSSHKSSVAVAPSRARGRARVSAILEAAGALFSEQGYDGVTMTAIAERSDTAIGSLYRFFPTKALVADALIERYGEASVAAFDALAAGAEGMSAPEVAAGLIGTVRIWRGVSRDAASALLGTRADDGGARLRIRAVMLDGVARVLQAWSGSAVPGEVAGAALQMLKSLSTSGQYAGLADGPDGEAVQAETALALEAYLVARVGQRPRR